MKILKDLLQLFDIITVENRIWWIYYYMQHKLIIYEKIVLQ